MYGGKKNLFSMIADLSFTNLQLYFGIVDTFAKKNIFRGLYFLLSLESGAVLTGYALKCDDGLT